MGEIIATVRVQVQRGDHLETEVITERFADNGDGVLDASEIRNAEERIRANLAGREGVEVVDLSTRIHVEVSGGSPTGAGGARQLDLPVGNLVNNGVVKLFGSVGGCAPVGRWDRSENWAPIRPDPARGMPEEADGYHYTYYQEADRWDSVRGLVIPGRIARVPDHVSPGSTNVHNDIQLWDSGRNDWVRVGTYVVDGIVTTPGGRVPMLMYRTPQQLDELAGTHAGARPESDWRFHSVAGGFQYFDTASGEISRVAIGSSGGGRREILISGQAFTDSAVWRAADAYDSVPAARPVVPLRVNDETAQYALAGPTAGTGANAEYEMFSGTRAGSTETRAFRRRVATDAVPASNGNPAVPARPAGPLEVNMGTDAAPDWRVVGSGGVVGGPARPAVVHASGGGGRRAPARRAGPDYVF